MTDEQIEKLLELIDGVVNEEGSVYSRDITLEDFVEDLAMSMNVTTDKADSHRANIQAQLLT